jgi:enamine deaminase RidA (YjgF/YER057c/UK114 family)
MGYRRSACPAPGGGDAVGAALAGDRPALRPGLPVLAGEPGERLPAGADDSGRREGFTLFVRGPWLAGFATAAPGADIGEAARDLYRRLLSVVGERHLYRIWNTVPRINAVTGGAANYHHFCRGRSLAFEERFGGGFERTLPAASAVGSAAGPLALSFLAGQAAPRHFENPRQVPAFEYPPKYGPRPPSFSRATVAPAAGGPRVFISGTAAIRGHASVCDRDLDGQLRCIVENLALIGEATGAGADMGVSRGWRRLFKVYLRDAGSLPRVRGALDRGLLSPGDEVCFLRADICRPELLVEIEATLVPEPGR